MEQTQTTTSGVESASSAAETESNNSQLQSTSTEEIVTDAGGSDANYPKSHVDKLMREKKNLAAKLKEFEAQSKAKEQKELEEQQKWKELYEASRRELENSQTENKAFREKMTTAKKMSAVKQELSKYGLKPGKEEVAFKLLDVSGIAVDEETNTVIGVEDVVKKFYEGNSDLGIFGQSGPKVDQRAPSTTPIQKSLNELDFNEKLKLLAKFANKKG